MNLNKDPESWAKVNVDAVIDGSVAQAANVLKMALQDIARLAKELEATRQDRDRIGRNRDMWQISLGRCADEIHCLVRRCLQRS